METLKYKVVKSREQYDEYCNVLEELLSINTQEQDTQDEIELLTYLIEKWDEENNSFSEVDPITLLDGLMAEKGLKAKELADILGVSKGLVSDILNYKKGLSKDVIRALSSYFKVSQEAFNKPYKLQSEINSHLKNASVMNTVKEVETSREWAVNASGYRITRIAETQAEAVSIARSVAAKRSQHAVRVSAQHVEASKSTDRVKAKK